MPKPRFVIIGGFLGAGKTTAMVKLAGHLQGHGLRAGLITNDQGQNLVDTARVRAAGFPVREITAGCFCCRFDSLLQASRQLIDQTAPDVLIAEPVGSCTDLLATVSCPLRQLYGENYDIAPHSVLVDPIRCTRVLGLQPGKSFAEKVLYVYRKQLEESQLLVINKVDLLPAADRRTLAQALGRQFPQSRILQVSCQTGEGLAEWFQAVLTDPPRRRPAMQVDYDLYADGEALLGWLNATARLSASDPFDANQWLAALALKLRGLLTDAGGDIAHLKMTLQPDEGLDLASVSLIAADANPELTFALSAPLAGGLLTVNLRAQADPVILQRLLREALADSQPVTAAVEQINAFRPGRPMPTHRMATG